MDSRLRTDLKAAIRSIPDYPKPGIVFRDITTLLGDPRAFRRSVDELVHPFAGGRRRQGGGNRGAGLHHRRRRGASALGRASCRSARRASCRTKPCASPIRSNTASTRWRSTRMPSARMRAVILVDDLIATGGTAIAATQLLRQMGARIVAACFIIDLPESRRGEEAAGARRGSAQPREFRGSLIPRPHRESREARSRRIVQRARVLRDGLRPPQHEDRRDQVGRRSQNTAPSNEITGSPCWLKPSLRWVAMPQPGREAEIRLPVMVLRNAIVSPA